MARTFGIVNLTRDSFSDGGRFFAPEAALEHARMLRAHGADVLDLGAESTHPDAEDVPAAEEIRRLSPVVKTLLDDGAVVSIDTCKPVVMRTMVELGAQWLNDVHGFRDDEALAVVAAAPATVRFVVMFSRSRGARADRPADATTSVLDELHTFFAERVVAFARMGVGKDRLAFDPGMGFFLGRTAAPSLLVLNQLRQLQVHGVPLLVSVSRKSLVGEITGRAVDQRGPGTLAAELWAARHGAQWIRTHDVAAFRDAWATESAIDAAR